MAQLGLHGIIGVAVSKGLAKNDQQETGKNLRWGVVLGSILPDADFFLLGPLYLVSTELGLAMHRTFTHSLLVLGIILLLLYLSLGRGSDNAKWALAKGIVIGILLHIAADILIWFSAVDLLWPLGFVGVASKLDLWASITLPPVVPKLLGAFDYLFFALFYIMIARKAVEKGLNLDHLPKVKVFTYLNLIFFVVYTALAITSIAPGTFDIFHYAVFILVGLPMMLYTAFKMRETIAGFWETGYGDTPLNQISQ